MVYIYLNRLMSQESLDKGLARVIIDDHKSLPILSRIKDNFSKEIWKSRFEYYIKYAFIPNLPL